MNGGPGERFLVRWGETGHSFELRLPSGWRALLALLSLILLALFAALAWVTWTLAHGYPMAWYEERRQAQLQRQLVQMEAKTSELRVAASRVDSLAVRTAARFGLPWNQASGSADPTRRPLLDRLFPEETPSLAVAQEAQAQDERISAHLRLWQAARQAQAKCAKAWENTPSVVPAAGHFSSPFGYRVNPVTGIYQLHAGMDIENHTGTPIHAPAGGVVEEQEASSSYGNYVLVRHGGGIRTRYAHMSAAKVRVGQVLKRGDLIGLMGSTGRSTGTHLHYEVIVGGSPVNPTGWLLPMRIDP
jgi:murein DD-endopeptidase MepM/ murein hydrolase activator NlpD